LVKKGGPELSEYHEFTEWLTTINRGLREGSFEKGDLRLLQNEMGEALSVLTLQGFAFHKPHGYPGDYEMIEKIYLKHTSNNPKLRKWDLYFQLQKAPFAVRNRKKYFVALLNSIHDLNRTNRCNKVLNIASGPARDLFDFFSLKKDCNIRVDNVEFDSHAISYAKILCQDFLGDIDFLHTNVFDFTTDKRYRLIWCAGLFDYLNDKKFIFLLRHVSHLLGKDAELVVGNFSSENPTQAYMEVIGDWRLNHRTPDQLVSLAKACNFRNSDIRIGKETEGVNLFLHIKCGKDFILQ
jgi:hypothetical protein